MKLGGVSAVFVALISMQLVAAEELADSARKSMLQAGRFFSETVAMQGSYLWQYSADLKLREGEGRATATQGWMQPPGTPAVGMTFLRAWQATGNDFFLAAARETAAAVLQAQLRSGGWHYAVEFDPGARRKIAYRMGGGDTNGARNVTTLDDDVTQSAVRFLIRLDEALAFEDDQIHEAVTYAIQQLIRAQYPNGAWPQGYDHFPEPEHFPIKAASYPETWPRRWPGSRKYWERYTLNDNSHTTTIEMLLEAVRTYGKAQAPSKSQRLAGVAQAAVRQAGEFLLLAQMPEPQPAWAQQYDFEMHPSWARKFEPPAISGGESQEVLRVLLLLYRETGEARYLEPIPRALAYLRRSRLGDGRLARFYELKSNRPLYLTRSYELTYRDDNLPTHYSFKVKDETDSIEAEYNDLRSVSWSKPKPAPRLPQARELITEIRRIIAAQDNRGAWVEAGNLRSYGMASVPVIRAATFNKHMNILSDYLDAIQGPGERDESESAPVRDR